MQSSYLKLRKMVDHYKVVLIGAVLFGALLFAAPNLFRQTQFETAVEGEILYLPEDLIDVNHGEYLDLYWQTINGTFWDNGFTLYSVNVSINGGEFYPKFVEPELIEEVQTVSYTIDTEEFQEGDTIQVRIFFFNEVNDTVLWDDVIVYILGATETTNTDNTDITTTTTTTRSSGGLDLGMYDIFIYIGIGAGAMILILAVIVNIRGAKRR